MPTIKAIAIMPYSKARLCMMLIPNKGRLDRNKGNKAQWIAQATEVVIPKASQFIFSRMGSKDISMQLCCKIVLLDIKQ